MFRSVPVRVIVVLLAGVVAGAACSGGSKRTAPPTTTAVPTTAVATTTPRSVASRTTATVAPTSTSTPPTTAQPCPGGSGAGATVVNTASNSVLLTNISTTSDRCIDRVAFSFTATTPGKPGYVVSYGSAPFHEDASGNPVDVPGSGFIVVKIKPGYTYDFETGTRTYNGPARITPSGAAHVRAIVRTGDYEGVLTWVIGTNGKRPYTVQASAGARPQLVVTIS